MSISKSPNCSQGEPNWAMPCGFRPQHCSWIQDEETIINWWTRATKSHLAVLWRFRWALWGNMGHCLYSFKSLKGLILLRLDTAQMQPSQHPEAQSRGPVQRSSPSNSLVSHWILVNSCLLFRIFTLSLHTSCPLVTSLPLALDDLCLADLKLLTAFDPHRTWSCKGSSYFIGCRFALALWPHQLLHL